MKDEEREEYAGPALTTNVNQEEIEVGKAHWTRWANLVRIRKTERTKVLHSYDTRTFPL